MSISGHLLEESYLSADKQSVYSTAPGDWAKSWMQLLAFHIVFIPLEKVWVQLFSLQINSRADWALYSNRAHPTWTAILFQVLLASHNTEWWLFCLRHILISSFMILGDDILNTEDFSLFIPIIWFCEYSCNYVPHMQITKKFKLSWRKCQIILLDILLRVNWKLFAKKQDYSISLNWCSRY